MNHDVGMRGKQEIEQGVKQQTEAQPKAVAVVVAGEPSQLRGQPS